MKLWFVLALVLLLGKAPAQEAANEMVVPPGKNPFLAEEYLRGGARRPLQLSSVDFDLWKLAEKVAGEPAAYPPGTGIAIGGPVANLQIALPPGQKGSGFKIAVYPRETEKDGLMYISRVTTVETVDKRVSEARHVGWYYHEELRKLCEAESLRVLAEQTAKEEPLRAYSVIASKEGSPGVWIEKLHVVNVSNQPLLIESVWLRVLKSGTREELRKVEVTWPPKMKRIDGKKQIELLPRSSTS